MRRGVLGFIKSLGNSDQITLRVFEYFKDIEINVGSNLDTVPHPINK